MTFSQRVECLACVSGLKEYGNEEECARQHGVCLCTCAGDCAVHHLRKDEISVHRQRNEVPGDRQTTSSELLLGFTLALKYPIYARVNEPLHTSR